MEHESSDSLGEERASSASQTHADASDSNIIILTQEADEILNDPESILRQYAKNRGGWSAGIHPKFQERIRERLSHKHSKHYVTSLRMYADQLGLPIWWSSDWPEHAASRVEESRRTRPEMTKAFAAALVFDARNIFTENPKRKFTIDRFLRLLFDASAMNGLIGEVAQEQIKMLDLSELRKHTKKGIQESPWHLNYADLSSVAVHRLEKTWPDSALAREIIDTTIECLWTGNGQSSVWTIDFFEELAMRLSPAVASKAVRAFLTTSPGALNKLGNLFCTIKMEAARIPSDAKEYRNYCISEDIGGWDTLNKKSRHKTVKLLYPLVMQCQDDISALAAAMASQETRQKHSQATGKDTSLETLRAQLPARAHELLMSGGVAAALATLTTKERNTVIDRWIASDPFDVMRVMHVIDIQKSHVRRLLETTGFTQNDCIRALQDINPIALLGKSGDRLGYSKTAQKNFAKQMAWDDPLALLAQRENIRIAPGILDCAETSWRSAVRENDQIGRRAVRRRFDVEPQDGEMSLPYTPVDFSEEVEKS